jgi:hypothetical protein
MVLVLYLWILFYLGLLAAGGYGSYRIVRRLGQARNVQRQRRLQGATNLRLLREHREEVCCFCLEPTEPSRDVWDERLGWYHPPCHEKIVG